MMLLMPTIRPGFIETSMRILAEEYKIWHDGTGVMQLSVAEEMRELGQSKEIPPTNVQRDKLLMNL
jgi:hypothetical protein